MFNNSADLLIQGSMFLPYQFNLSMALEECNQEKLLL